MKFTIGKNNLVHDAQLESWGSGATVVDPRAAAAEYDKHAAAEKGESPLRKVVGSGAVFHDEKQNVVVTEHLVDSSEELEWDRGVDAWCALVGGWLAMTSTFGYQSAYGIYQDYYSLNGTASPSLISWIGSTQLFLLTSMGLITGKLVDMGYLRHSVFVGSVLYVFSLFMVSLADPHKYYQLFLSQGLGMGLGAGLIYIPCLAVQAHYWKRRQAMAIGIVFTGTAVGGIIFPILLNQLLNRGFGFAWTVRISAFVVLAFMALSNFLMRPRIPAHELAAPKQNLKELFLDVPFMVMVFGAFLCLAGVFFPYFYIQVYARTHGVHGSIAFYTLAILNAASIPGRIIPSALSHRYGVFNMLLICVTSCAAAIFALFGISTVAEIIVFAIISGFFSGSVTSLLAVACASFARAPSEVGLRMGLSFAIAACGGLAGTPIDGALLGDSYTWSHAVIYTGATLCAGVVFLAIARHMVVNQKGSRYV